MALKRVSEPSIEPVSLEEAKAHLNYDATDKDALIEALISAARAHVENICHIAVAQSEWLLTYDEFPSGALEIPKSPLISIDAVVYDDADGIAQTIDSADYFVDASQPFGWLIPNDDWPETLSAANAVRVTFTAGYAIQSGDVNETPKALRQAILLLIGQWFENRDPLATGTIAEMPNAVEALIAPYRVPVIA